MQTKSFIFLILLTVITVSTAKAQYCGGSYLNLELKFEKNVKTAKKVNYELFYVLPKLKNANEIWDEKTIDVL